jgi:hypothetical protein
MSLLTFAMFTATPFSAGRIKMKFQTIYQNFSSMLLSYLDMNILRGFRHAVPFEFYQISIFYFVSSRHLHFCLISESTYMLRNEDFLGNSMIKPFYFLIVPSVTDETNSKTLTRHKEQLIILDEFSFGARLFQ